MTGVGTTGHVQADPRYMQVLNMFFDQHPSYRFIKFHTHSKGTIARHGRYFAENFSSEDIAGIQEQLGYDDRFIALLVTPVKKVLVGRDRPELVVVPDDHHFLERDQQIRQELQSIASQSGIELPHFFARRGR